MGPLEGPLLVQEQARRIAQLEGENANLRFKIDRLDILGDDLRMERDRARDIAAALWDELAPHEAAQRILAELRGSAHEADPSEAS